MMDNDSTKHTVDRMQSLLEQARQELRRSVIRGYATRAFVAIAWVSATAALLELAAMWIASHYAAQIPDVIHVMVGVGGVALILIIAAILTRTIREMNFTWLEVAQRLDATCDTHNRIATSWSLSNEECPSVFALAAIQQGLARLEAVGGQRPALPNKPALCTRPFALISGMALAAGCVLTWAVLSGEGIPAIDAGTRVAFAQGSGPVTSTAPAMLNDEPDPTPGNASRPASPVIATAQAGPTVAASTVAANQDRRRQGQSAIGARGSSDRQQATGSPGDPDANPSSGAPVAARKTAREGNAESHSQSSGNGASSSSGMISGGGAGRGRAVPVKNQGQQREAPANGELEADRDDEPVDEEQTANEQRGGVQPALPDRTEAPSRELGITGPQSGKPGTGRGGPSPAKKARGAAALLMGVPIPDFVKGKAGPGATAVTIEEASPVAAPGDVGSAMTARRRSEPESIIPRYDISWSDASIVQEYSRRWQRRMASTGRIVPHESAGFPSDSHDLGTSDQGASRP